MKATRLIAEALCVSIAFAPACGDDDSSATGAEGTGGSGEESVPATYDDVTQALIASGPLGKQMVDVIVDSPFGLEAGLRDANFICGDTDAGSCPSKTVECQAAKVTKVTLAFKEADNCKDGSGAPLKGTLVFDRNGAQDWTVAFQSLDRNGVVLNGDARFQSAVGQPWSVTLDLKLTGAASGSKEDSSCTKSCVKSQTYNVTYVLTLATGTPISVDMGPATTKKAVINGSVNATGTLTGHVKVTAKGPLGGDQTPVDRDINATYTNHGVKFANVTYALPPTCTCPESGSLSTATERCGDMTASFGTGGACAKATVTVTGTANFCPYVADVAELAIGAACDPIQ